MCEWFSLLPIAVDASFIGQWVKHWKTVRWILVFVQFWWVWCRKQLPVSLPLWAAIASLPLCLKPNTRSIHSWRCSDTYWLSSAVLCFWRKSLISGVTDRIQEIRSSTQTDSNSYIIKQHRHKSLTLCWRGGEGGSGYDTNRVCMCTMINRKLPEAHGGRMTSPTKRPFCFLPKSRFSLFSRKLESLP